MRTKYFIEMRNLTIKLFNVIITIVIIVIFIINTY